MVKTFRRAAQELKRERHIVFTFPEGRRSHADWLVMGNVKMAAFQAVMPVLPLYVGNTGAY